MVEKKNSDYKDSAIKLENNPKLAEMLNALYELQESERIQQGAIQAFIPEEAVANLRNCRVQIEQLKAEIKTAMDSLGSYQNIEKGWYAIKQSRSSIVYSVENCRKFIPDFAKAVIDESVNEDKIKGLLKGKLITQEDVDKFSKKVSDSPAFIIKAK
jgi:hypothetical protein